MKPPNFRKPDSCKNCAHLTEKQIEHPKVKHKHIYKKCHKYNCLLSSYCICDDWSKYDTIKS